MRIQYFDTGTGEQAIADYTGSISPNDLLDYFKKEEAQALAEGEEGESTYSLHCLVENKNGASFIVECRTLGYFGTFMLIGHIYK